MTDSTQSTDTNTWNMLCHLSALSGLIIPFGNLIGPLVVWSLKKAEIPSVDQHGKEALNFNITFTIAAFVGVLLCFVIIGFVILPIIGLAWLILTVIATIKASKGESYTYPLTLRLVK